MPASSLLCFAKSAPRLEAAEEFMALVGAMQDLESPGRTTFFSVSGGSSLDAAAGVVLVKPPSNAAAELVIFEDTDSAEAASRGFAFFSCAACAGSDSLPSMMVRPSLPAGVKGGISARGILAGIGSRVAAGAEMRSRKSSPGSCGSSSSSPRLMTIGFAWFIRRQLAESGRLGTIPSKRPPVLRTPSHMARVPSMTASRVCHCQDR
mmetsp:Transcript_63840/g.101465  ORF Transcript_63840/g.101465 Transcript_63840/m.101465 type:complete len:207 (+) Transcript_63840:943-1563(+)